MMEGLIACFAWIGLIIGIAFIVIGFGEVARGEGFNWSAVKNKSLFGGSLCLLVV